VRHAAQEINLAPPLTAVCSVANADPSGALRTVPHGIRAPARAAWIADIKGVHEVSLGTLLLIVVILVLAGALPTWNHSRSWGYMPSGVLGVVLVVMIVMLLTGRL
jgi:hypothetical protein